ncbi:DUF2793 domain-containing protein [Jiella sonneratiae]|uniref:DUF2793 domain-containing protein n=1 Tax=Jiella sonneratiae TaxID=2816856 RepID=A0ABS3J267_9HYPH|nr:DUF2793 domain-containing protein [Jiella sonneratiae]MBO0902666.1 DUF2793 domain-containing protein [Jiella sonneratiae]
MSDTTDRLALPYILADQAQKHVTHNEALARLDALVHLAVLDRDRAEPPAEPGAAARHVVAAEPSGAWSGREGSIAVWQDGAWLFLEPETGWRAWCVAEKTLLVYGDEGWSAAGPGAADFAAGVLSRLGVNTAADGFNRLAVKTSALLVSHDDVSGDGNGSVLGTFNKEASGNDAGFNFQSGWSTRALMGLYGDEDFRIKVSPDGATFHDAMVVGRATGIVSFPKGGVREQLAADRTYWVRTDGDDANDGLADTASGAFRTIQHAVDVANGLDAGIHTVTISVAAGSYDEAVRLDKAKLGTMQIVGDVTTPANVSTRSFNCSNGAIWSVRGFRLTFVNGIRADTRGQLSFDRIDFQGTGVAIYVNNALAIGQGATLKFGSGVTTIASLYNYGFLTLYGATLDLAAGTAWSSAGAFFLTLLSLAWLQAATFTGSTATGKRYSIGLNSTLSTGSGGANFIPGDAAGSTATGGQYV